VRKLIRMTGFAAASGCFAFAAPAAQACALTPVTVVGGDLSPEQREAWEKERAGQDRARVAAERERFRTDVLVGTIDSAEGLAEVLVPNVREWWGDRSDCGPSGDGDGPPMPVDEQVEAAFTGTELDELDGNRLGELFPRFRRDFHYELGNACNLEFRSRFAERVRRDVPRTERDAAYLVLSGSGAYRVRYYRFADAKRTVPRETVTGWAAGLLADPSLRGVTQSIADFWTEMTPQLGDPALVCPAAHQAMLERRGQELDHLRETGQYDRVLRGIARARAAVPPPSSGTGR
jgi:hypothetical protein